ncbi:MAG: DUF3696 domain-containing protein [Cetobacterium sp.]|uniref:AAA family ATPase n=1 Tax=Cetobacterium sp. TaxID=2071632 RepID=UPI002FCAFE0B
MKLLAVEYKNFKCLEDERIELGNLTLLSGVNSSGKSTTIQGIILLKQNIQQLPTNLIDELNMEYSSFYKLITRIRLNGVYTKLGTVSKVLYKEAKKDIINLKLITENSEILFESNLDKIGDRTKEDNYPCTVTCKGTPEVEFLIKETFQYLSADRISPSSHYPYSNEDVELNNIGTRGEYVAHFLNNRGKEDLNILELKHCEASNNTISENVSKWISTISKGLEVVSSVDTSTMQSYLNYRYEGDIFGAKEVGFGITYSLPIIVAILKSKPGDILIIENPESHLHPAGQVQIARLCSKAANYGVQIIIESHSDHFLNGIRVAIKEKVLSEENTKIYFFKKDYKKSEILTLGINTDGGINQWPQGFFDEFENQLVKLI